jgi:hypothetical protein
VSERGVAPHTLLCNLLHALLHLAHHFTTFEVIIYYLRYYTYITTYTNSDVTTHVTRYYTYITTHTNSDFTTHVTTHALLHTQVVDGVLELQSYFTTYATKHALPHTRTHILLYSKSYFTKYVATHTLLRTRTHTLLHTLQHLCKKKDSLKGAAAKTKANLTLQLTLN